MEEVGCGEKAVKKQEKPTCGCTCRYLDMRERSTGPRLAQGSGERYLPRACTWVKGRVKGKLDIRAKDDVWIMKRICATCSLSAGHHSNEQGESGLVY